MAPHCLISTTAVSSPFPLPDSLAASLKRRCIRPCRVTPGSYKAHATAAVTSGGSRRTASAQAATEAEAASQGLGNGKNLHYSAGQRAAAAQDHNQNNSGTWWGAHAILVLQTEPDGPLSWCWPFMPICEAPFHLYGRTAHALSF